ncbi:uncharacterized protein N7511_011522 [Penicillium nucicola]|uniref:uncharacterized protein n=1 Tax=Penicillium nucicola TaxID=1850975 RepID=UPI0025454F29|nr:uncharacterized protein N7511_011522 [Penicillium nucicola]KAJ5742503.1 hypothetical protein N7511_011522 [Penicillium nucicola]
MTTLQSREKKDTATRNLDDFWGFDSTLPTLPSSTTSTDDVIKLASQKLALLKQAQEEHR